ncbi:hypothetical protein DXG01_013538 [Tephrocybe rancida]|nr:hypothetical protein DXG01_013538 [Tephrocybe rancida]
MLSPRPHLPLELIAKITQDSTLSTKGPSAVFSQDFHAIRLKIVDCRKPETANTIYDISGCPRKVSRADQKVLMGHIHLAAEVGDPLTIYELIRLGCTADLQDGEGLTALIIVMGHIATIRLGTHLLLRTSSTMLARFKLIARILLDQHADVNHNFEGLTPLLFACRAADWEMIELLLKHGARPNLDPSSTGGASTRFHLELLHTPQDIVRFHSLVHAYPSSLERPPQKCPCWSGKSLGECHAAKRVPYPADFYCICGSKKSYGTCCAHRNNVVTEIWDHEYRYIKQISTVTVTPSIPIRGRGGPGEIVTSKEACVAFACSLPREQDPYALSEPAASRFLHSLIISLKPRNAIDPAFEFALKEVLFLPRPFGRMCSKNALEAAERQWNAAVDKYISSSAAGTRSADDIERAAKIDRSGGALYKACEGANCERSESRGSPKFRVCSKCKMSVYCSRECQTSAWKAHKIICGDPDQREQALPSQIAIEEFLNNEGEDITLPANFIHADT